MHQNFTWMQPCNEFQLGLWLSPCTCSTSIRRKKENCLTIGIGWHWRKESTNPEGILAPHFTKWIMPRVPAFASHWLPEIINKFRRHCAMATAGLLGLVEAASTSQPCNPRSVPPCPTSALAIGCTFANKISVSTGTSLPAHKCKGRKAQAYANSIC